MEWNTTQEHKKYYKRLYARQIIVVMRAVCFAWFWLDWAQKYYFDINESEREAQRTATVEAVVSAMKTTVAYIRFSADLRKVFDLHQHNNSAYT